MKNFGYIRVGSCSPEVRAADIDHNIRNIIEASGRFESENVDLAVFPELSVTGYTCADLFGQTLLLDRAEQALGTLARELADKRITIVVGVPLRHNGRLYNCAAVIQGGRISGIVPKTHIPNYGEFYEKRWFASGKDATGEISVDSTRIPFGTDLLFSIDGIKFGIEICEDLWVPQPPGARLATGGADIIVNLSATNELIGKHRYLLDLIRNQSARCRCGYVYASAGAGESSTDLAFAGNCIIAENGSLLAESRRFEMQTKTATADLDIEMLRHDRTHFETFNENSDGPELRVITVVSDDKQKESDNLLKYRKVKAHPFLDENPLDLKERCDEISSIQAWGLATRLKAINCRSAIVGISGGLDSTLALLVTVKAFDMLGFDRTGITGITMPGFGTTGRTKSNATRLMELLGVTQREIPIGDAVRQHFEAIGHDPAIHDVTYENSQARERTQILMDVANQLNGIVIGTGDLSELALGWCTYNGDQMSMYGVNASIPKTLVRYLVNGYAENSEDPRLTAVLQDIIDTPISPELLPPDANNDIEQKTEDLVGPYELHDFFLYHTLRFGAEPRKILLLARKAFGEKYHDSTIRHWLKTFYRRFFSQQFKRSCMPDGIKAGSVCLSPRGDWRMPSDAVAALWIEEAGKEEDN
ncbi:MAG: NAD(+) synthase [Muribaculaceae bacterium]|nr:NAD(+) synthase [Muribaculaceae bacterium]